jgi:hypothetical protein
MYLSRGLFSIFFRCSYIYLVIKAYLYFSDLVKKNKLLHFEGVGRASLRQLQLF